MYVVKHLIPKWPPFWYSLSSKDYFPLNEATRANLEVNNKILKWWSFSNKVYLL